MGTIRRQSIQGTLIIAFGVILGLVLRLFIFTAYLSVEEVGLLTVLLDAANIFAAFIPLGSQSIFIKYLPFFREKKNDPPTGILLIGGVLTLIGFILFTVLFLLFREPITTFYSKEAGLFAKYIFYLIPLVFARVIFVVGFAYANALKKNLVPLAIKEILVRILTGLVIIFFASNWFDLDGLVLVYVGIYFISGSILTYYLFSKQLLDFSSPRTKLKQGKGFEILRFGFFAILTSAGDIIIRNIDSLMITSLKGLGSAGIYSIAFFIGQIIEMPRRALGQITVPFIAEASTDGDHKMISTLYHKSSITQFLAGSLLLICVWTNIDSLLLIIPNGEDYAPGKYVVLFIGLAKLFDMSMGVNGEIIQQSKFYRFNFYTMALLGMLGISTNLLLIPQFGINGAAIASLISLFIANIIRTIYVKWRFSLSPFKSNSIVAVLIAIATYFVASYLPQLSWSIVDIFYRSSISIAVFTLLAIKFNVSEDLNNLVRSLRKKHFR